MKFAKNCNDCVGFFSTGWEPVEKHETFTMILWTGITCLLGIFAYQVDCRSITEALFGITLGFIFWIDAVINAWVLVSDWGANFLDNNILGHWVYDFVGREDGLCHVHKEKPTEVHKDFPIFFRRRIGGWFKESEVLTSEGKKVLKNYTWKVHSWGWKMRLRDYSGMEIRGIASPLSALEIVNRFCSINDTSSTTDRIRDTLGKGIFGLIEKIEGSKKTMGKSKHAQTCREDLEKLLNIIENEFEEEGKKLVMRWKGIMTS